MSEAATIASTKRAKRRIGPATQPARWAQHDARTREAKLVETVRRELIRHVGGSPTIAERLLLDRCAMLTLHITRLDARALEEGGFSSHATREYLAWTNTLRRSLCALGLKGVADGAPASLDDLLSASDEE